MTSPDVATRHRIDATSRLLGAADGWDHARDLADATTLLAVTSRLTMLYDDLDAAGVPSAHLRHVEGRLLERASRELTGRIWEEPRRRLAGRRALSDKFAYGGLWSPGAAELVLAPDGTQRPDADWKNKLILEHVVPAGTVTFLLRRQATTGAGAAAVARMLGEVVCHVVLTREDDRSLPRVLAPDVRRALAAHYLGEEVVSDEALFELRWSRYLGADLPFELAALDTLTARMVRAAGDRPGTSGLPSRREGEPSRTAGAVHRQRSVGA